MNIRRIWRYHTTNTKSKCTVLCGFPCLRCAQHLLSSCTFTLYKTTVFKKDSNLIPDRMYLQLPAGGRSIITTACYECGIWIERQSLRYDPDVIWKMAISYSWTRNLRVIYLSIWINWMNNLLTNRPSVRPTKRPSDRLTNRLTIWITDWLTHERANEWRKIGNSDFKEDFPLGLKRNPTVRLTRKTAKNIYLVNMNGCYEVN